MSPYDVGDMVVGGWYLNLNDCYLLSFSVQGEGGVSEP